MKRSAIERFFTFSLPSVFFPLLCLDATNFSIGEHLCMMVIAWQLSETWILIKYKNDNTLSINKYTHTCWILYIYAITWFAHIVMRYYETKKKCIVHWTQIHNNWNVQSSQDYSFYFHSFIPSFIQFYISVSISASFPNFLSISYFQSRSMSSLYLFRSVFILVHVMYSSFVYLLDSFEILLYYFYNDHSTYTHYESSVSHIDHCVSYFSIEVDLIANI